MWLRDATGLTVAGPQRDSNGETTGGAHQRAPGGSPFQMPARLADGLGPESDPGDGSHRRSPLAEKTPPHGSPALPDRKARQLRLHQYN
jgi:hypothetical protein